MCEKEFNVEYIQSQLGGYHFKYPTLLKQAFTRKSFTEENGGENNEVLEFIGDKVLDIAVVRYLATEYGTDIHIAEKMEPKWHCKVIQSEFKCRKTEGELTRIKQRLVEKKTLAERIDALDLAKFLVMGQGDVKAGLNEEASVKEDLFEAVLGAVAIDCDWDFKIIQNVVEVMLCPGSYIGDGEEVDYVGSVCQWSEKHGTKARFYYKSIEGHSDYDENVIYGDQSKYVLNNAKYECQVEIHGMLKLFGGYGLSKNEARKEACKIAYKCLIEWGLLSTVKDEIKDPSIEMAINQLETLHRRGYISMPEYVFEESYDGDGNPIWRVECKIEEMEQCFESKASSKKQAKKKAALEMLYYVLDNYKEKI